ncbi:phage major tail protein [Fictibacillus macauensis ZFHKF-1]|uniref:Phage major tail protein n=1 Tax=Fictibacillus macauensis ZFHKF-1 TaxID=1196324 RepID=I8UGF1_9BACL|nr:major tail protein [Fictibacillus macauensis]EIT85908.1 phage major tail protein [Fictibacillus macauensis ZFHKF-1]
MATVGFEKAYIGILDKDGYATKVHEINAMEGGAIDAKISGLGAAMNTTYASNVPFHVSAQGTSNPKVDLSVADLPSKVYTDIMGAEKGEDGIIKIGAKTRPPYVALILKSADKDGNGLYLGFTKGKFTQDGGELKTQEDKGVELQTDSITGEFIARGSDEYVFGKGSTADPGFTPEKFKQWIMPTKAGNTP